jgi:hypothetical protein
MTTDGRSWLQRVAEFVTYLKVAKEHSLQLSDE